MSTERIQIIVSSSGTVTVKKDLEGIGTSARRGAGGVDFLRGALLTLISGATVAGILRLADAGTQLTNALTVAGLSGQGLINTQNQLFQIAKENGQEVNGLAAIYQRLNSVQGQLGIGQDDIIEALKNISAGFKISASSAGAQAGALQQLQQLLGGTVVQMQEVNSLVDGAFPILQAVARGTEEFGGNVGALINRLREGGYSVKAFFDGLQRGSDINRQLAEDWNLSISQALANFRTNLIQTVLELNQATGAFTILANGINFAGNNLGLFAAILTPVIAALTFLAVQTIGSLVVSAFTSFISMVMAAARAMLVLNAALWANPWTLALAGISAVVIALVGFDGVIKGAIVSFAKLAELFYKLKGDAEGAKWAMELTVNADKAVADLKVAADEIKNSLSGGAGQLGGAIKEGAKTGAADLKTGMKEGGTLAKEDVKSGGDQAGAAMKEGIVGGVQQSMPTVYNTIESAFATLAPLMEVFEAFLRREFIELKNLIAETGKLNAETKKLKAETDAIRNGGRNNGGSGASYGTGSGGGGSGGGASMMLPNFGNNTPANTNTVTTTQTAAPAGVNIINVVDPKQAIAAFNSAEGKKAILNVIKNDPAEFAALLGVA